MRYQDQSQEERTAALDAHYAQVDLDLEADEREMLDELDALSFWLDRVQR